MAPLNAVDGGRGGECVSYESLYHLDNGQFFYECNSFKIFDIDSVNQNFQNEIFFPLSILLTLHFHKSFFIYLSFQKLSQPFDIFLKDDIVNTSNQTHLLDLN